MQKPTFSQRKNLGNLRKMPRHICHQRKIFCIVQLMTWQKIDIDSALRGKRAPIRYCQSRSLLAVAEASKRSFDATKKPGKSGFFVGSTGTAISFACRTSSWRR
jgi:hypothetical protein